MHCAMHAVSVNNLAVCGTNVHQILGGRRRRRGRFAVEQEAQLSAEKVRI